MPKPDLIPSRPKPSKPPKREIGSPKPEARKLKRLKGPPSSTAFVSSTSGPVETLDLSLPQELKVIVLIDFVAQQALSPEDPELQKVKKKLMEAVSDKHNCAFILLIL